MNQGFFELNNSAISQIMDFVRSSYGIFYLFGPKGSSKSETIEKVVPELEKNYLIFRHFCFENSVIDDFLLNFYDSLKNFSLSGKVAFKKFATDDFKEKVSHYLKTLDKKCIIIIENYEKIDTNKEIADFLIHLSNYPNVKILIVSRNKNTILHGMSIKTFQFEGISKEDFKSKLSILMNTVDEETKENFYIITQGIELYLNMSIKYCTNTNITISDLINEFTRRNEPFEHFIVSKFITLTPSNYRDFYSMLSILSHPVNTEFIESYKLGNTNYIEYLLKNFLVSKYNNEIC